MAVSVATGIGGIETLEEQIVVNAEKGPRRVSPFLVPMMMPNSAGASVSMKYGWQGPCESIVTACAAGTHGITRPADLIAWDRFHAVIAGGSVAALTPTSLPSFSILPALPHSGVSLLFTPHTTSFLLPHAP